MKNNLLSIDEYRNNPEFYFSKGLRYANKKNLKDAYKNLVKAAKLEPDNSEYKFNLACFLSEMNKPREANRIFNDILINFDPTLFDCYFGLGCNWLELGNAEKAAEYFEKYLYFDGEGEFNEEVREMSLYLKLYNDISNNKKFLKLSKSNYKKAVKSFEENNISSGIKELYRAISLNPFNIEARNLLTMMLMEQGQFERALYINETVINTFPGEIWANCLNIYILSYFKKNTRVNRALSEIVYSDINNRDELLCVAATLLIFNRISDFIKVLEMYIVAYSDSLIYSALLLGYMLSENNNKTEETIAILSSIDKSSNLMSWIKQMQGYSSKTGSVINAIDEYEKLFAINSEKTVNYISSPVKYRQLFEIKKSKNSKITSKYMHIINCALEHREIMYTPHYEKEIMKIFNNILKLNDESYNEFDDRIEGYSAALEYIYCIENCIEMDKEELKQKYSISSIIFNSALKRFNYR